jgi:hypothetical protein
VVADLNVAGVLLSTSIIGTSPSPSTEIIDSSDFVNARQLTAFQGLWALRLLVHGQSIDLVGSPHVD